MERHNLFRWLWGVICSTPFWLVVIVLAAFLPLYEPQGFLNTRGGGDSPFLLQRTQQLVTAIQDGHFPVRWMPDANYGYGYPFFNFYAPLSIYVAAGFRFLGFSYTVAIQLAQLAGLGVAAWGMYRLGKGWWGTERAGIFAAAAYTFAPFHLVNLYVRGDSLAEFWAMAFYPLILLAMDSSLAKNGRPHWQQMGLLALSYAGLILSHNISALIFSPFVGLYMLIRLRQQGLQPFPYWVMGLVWGLGLAAWFWMPALTEQSLVQLEPVTSGYFHYSGHFRDGFSLVQPSLLFDYDVSAGNGGAFRMGLGQLLVILLGMIPLVWYKQPNLPRLFLGLGLLLATAMIGSLSRPLWDFLPLLSYTQFPWRFLSVQAFVGALVSAGTIRRFPQAIYLLLPFLFLTSLGNLSTDHLFLTDADLTTERLAQYEWFTGNIGSTVSAEYLPHTASPRSYNSLWLISGQRDVAQTVSGLATAQLQQRQATEQHWQIQVSSPSATLLLPTLYWVGWQAKLDGQPIPIQPSIGSGLMQVEVPAGCHILQLQLRHTPIRLIAELLSLVAGLWLIWQWRTSMQRMLLGGVTLLLLALLLHLLPTPALPNNNLSWDFAQMGYLHHAPVPFSDGSILNSYNYSSETVRAGETLTITLFMKSGANMPASIALFSPAVTRPSITDQVAILPIEQQTQLLGATVVYELQIPANAPMGLYLPRLTILGATAMMESSQQQRGELFLRPVRVVPALSQPDPPNQPLAVRVQEGFVQDKTLFLYLAWWTEQPLNQHLSVSLRVSNHAGTRLSQFDTQPGYGFLPSYGWPARQWVYDRLAVPLPATINNQEQPLAITGQLYNPNGQAQLIRRLGELFWQEGNWQFRPTEPNFILPNDRIPIEITFAEVAQLRGYSLQPSANSLTLTLYWQALTPTADYFHFVHLLDEQGEIVVQEDAMPRQNSYPTSQWTTGEIVTDEVTLLLAGLPAGNYTLAMGLYQKVGDEYPRVPATTPDGSPLPENRLLIPFVYSPTAP